MNKSINRIDWFNKSFDSRKGGGHNRFLTLLVGATLGILTIHTTALAAGWTTDETQRVLTVATGETYNLTDQDVADLVSSGKDFAVRGAGTVVCAVDMKAFAKNAVLEEGITFSMETKNCFGTAVAANRSVTNSVTIRNGAALRLNKWETSGMLQNKKVYFEGAGPDGKGAIQVVKATWNSFNNDEFYLTGDAKISQDTRVDYYSFLNTCGHNLTVQHKGAWIDFGGSKVRNSASVASTVTNVGGGVLILQSDGNPFEGSADNVFCLTNSFYNTLWNVQNGWTLAFHENSGINAAKWVENGAAAPLNICNFSGPLEVQGASCFTKRTNSVMTVSGPLSGTGTITVDGGWLNLASANVSYTGEINVKAQAVHEPSWRAGLALRTDTALPLAGLSFADADLKLGDTFASALPPLTFTGEGATNRVTGGLLARQRQACSKLTVANGATVEVSSPLAVAEAAVGADGTLRAGIETSLVGNPGLMGYMSHSTEVIAKPSSVKLSSDFVA